ncbi:uncharacterized protein LOC121745894 [Salvia splendens]|uniref:uncharacterized protein LOC121745894 n=1 Tax=Salvia splendens TaxID=180675 RepID=UPI001C2727B7|nr:uncharacterized protein LOC121745894 [Salvia splendens]
MEEKSRAHMSSYTISAKYVEFRNVQLDKLRTGYTEDDYRLRVIPFALKGEADTWFMRLPPNSIRTWADFRSQFLDYFFPSTRTNALKKEIQGAHQDCDETPSQYWSGFKGMLDACPNNHMVEAEIFNNFDKGMTPVSKDLMNSSSGGDFSKLKVDPNTAQQPPLSITYQQPPAVSYQQPPAISYPPQSEGQPQWHIDDVVGDLMNSQQHIQGNMQDNNDLVHKIHDAQQEQKAAMDMLTKKLSQMDTTLNKIRGHDGRIPATVKMPDRANISKITLSSGKDYAEPLGRTDEGDSRENSEGTLLKEARGTSNAVKRLKPYPYRGEPKRFIKDFIAGKAKADGKIVIGESVSVVIQKRRLHSKRTDPGMFTLPIIIGDVKIEHAMCDMGASINVLPFSVYKRLTGVSLVDTKVFIQLADRSCISPEGVLENVIVRVHDFLYPADFHVIRMNEFEAGESSGVLLGRPFVRTTKTIIDVSDGTICLDYHGEKFTFNIDEAMGKPLDTENNIP